MKTRAGEIKPKRQLMQNAIIHQPLTNAHPIPAQELAHPGQLPHFI